ncbi:DUF4435 domain-containing protein [uncultured Agrobacterium sp.]|uniref:DUF4435 domain-containing protein n=1 Tax=uncultured Agrobacterium sp. TaxID=157277 RepID=UPI0025E545BB|nr:DUF4435 domain-containing protein [uncultured Agrobacterium sp.]
MSFRRSNAGISNYKRFLKVDYTVYIEGKSDVKYWKTMFEVFRPELRIDLKKRDGVKNLTDIVAGIANGSIKNVLVCRDSDYEVVSGEGVEHANIIYTYGYSFENDFFTAASAVSVVKFLSSEPVNSKLIKRAFSQYYRSLTKIGEWLLRMDISYGANGNNLINRSNPKHLLFEESGAKLSFDINQIVSGLKHLTAGRKKINFEPFGKVFPRYYCGHSIFFILIGWCRTIARRLFPKLPNASEVLIRNHLLSHFESVANSDAFNHVRSKLLAV